VDSNLNGGSIIRAMNTWAVAAMYNTARVWDLAVNACTPLKRR